MHIPVLLKEVIKYLNPKAGENFIDCTTGKGGHSFAILKENVFGKVLAIDLDKESIKFLKSKNKDRLFLVNDNFKNLKRVVEKYNFYPVNGILFDLGLSSLQLEERGKGFSFQKDEPLDMRFNEDQEITAKEIVNKFNLQKLEEIFRDYGEERFSRRIAKRIIEQRKIKPIKSSLELKKIIRQAIPFEKTGRGKTNRVLARIFQALRIEVNQELENLKQGLIQSIDILSPNGRLVVISFHSLEDRIVKHFFREQKDEKRVKILTKKPITPQIEEVQKNFRARSAKLRAIIKL